jgi:hypothetical protein
LIAAWRSTSEWKTPRCRRRRASEAKKVSTALAQEHEVGVKCLEAGETQRSVARSYNVSQSTISRL